MPRTFVMVGAGDFTLVDIARIMDRCSCGSPNGPVCEECEAIEWARKKVSERLSQR